MRSAECGVRSSQGEIVRHDSHPTNSAFRTPHSALYLLSRGPLAQMVRAASAAECYPPETSTGTVLFVVVPVPSCPRLFAPQQ